MARFRMDNTEGYSQSDLDEMNKRYNAAILATADDVDEIIRKSHEDYIAENVQAEFDAGCMGPTKTLQEVLEDKSWSF